MATHPGPETNLANLKMRRRRGRIDDDPGEIIVRNFRGTRHRRHRNRVARLAAQLIGHRSNRTGDQPMLTVSIAARSVEEDDTATGLTEPTEQLLRQQIRRSNVHQVLLVEIRHGPLSEGAGNTNLFGVNHQVDRPVESVDEIDDAFNLGGASDIALQKHHRC